MGASRLSANEAFAIISSSSIRLSALLLRAARLQKVDQYQHIHTSTAFEENRPEKRNAQNQILCHGGTMAPCIRYLSI